MEPPPHYHLIRTMAQDKRYIRFTGRLWADMSFELQLGWETEQIASLPHIDDDEYQIDLREDDQQLVTVTPRIDPFIPCSPGERTSVTPAQVVGYIPLHPDANRLVFRRDGRILYDTELASAPPDVEFESVEREDEDAIVLSWHAEHETGAHAELTYDIAYVADGEQAMLVAHALADTEHSVPLASLPGSERGQFAVLATDGLRSSVALSDPISVDVKPPRVWIQQPDPKTSYPADQPISLIGQAVDIGGERLPEEPLRWSSMEPPSQKAPIQHW